MDLTNRLEAFEALARERAVDVEALLRGFPDDPKLRLAAIATLLGVDAHQAVHTGVPLEQLTAERPEVATAAAEFARAVRPAPTSEEGS